MLEKIKLKIKGVKKIEDKELNDYLSNFNCNKCGNYCKLNNIKCKGGKQFQLEKTEEFYNK